MGDEGYDLQAATDAAWAELRRRLADAVAAMDDDDLILVEMVTGDDDQELDAAPYVQLAAWGDDLVRAEAVSNQYLDERWALTLDAEESLVEMGWEEPTMDSDPDADGGSANFWLDAERREADRVAVTCVRALREVYGVQHPSFLLTVGVDPEPTEDPDEGGATDGDDATADGLAVVLPRDRDHLAELMAEALSLMSQEPLSVDADGDVPFAVGDSVVFVRARTDRPAVELFAEILVDPDDRDRLAVELDILNRSHARATFFTRGRAVVMRQLVDAAPFVPVRLRHEVATWCEEVDQLARDLQLRVGGHLFTDDPEVEPSETGRPPSPGLQMLVELLHDGPVRAAVVAELFDHDRTDLVHQIVHLQQERVTCIPDDSEVLDHLRAGLRFVAEQAARARYAGRGSRRLRSQQLSLLADDGLGEATLDIDTRRA